MTQQSLTRTETRQRCALLHSPAQGHNAYLSPLCSHHASSYRVASIVRRCQTINVLFMFSLGDKTRAAWRLYYPGSRVCKCAARLLAAAGGASVTSISLLAPTHANQSTHTQTHTHLYIHRLLVCDVSAAGWLALLRPNQRQPPSPHVVRYAEGCVRHCFPLIDDSGCSTDSTLRPQTCKSGWGKSR